MPFDLTDRRLKKLYGRSPESIAFVDEAYRVDGHGEPFYIVSAVVVDGPAIDALRDTLLEIVGSDYWHTTKAFQKDGEALKETLRGLAQHLAHDGSVSLCTVDTDPAHFANVEQVRWFTMCSMASLLVEQHGVDLCVYERRREGAEETADRHIERTIQERPATRNLRMHGGTPYSEPLLWAPDVVASTLRRRIAFREGEWFEPLREKTTIFKAGTADTVKMSPLN
ncbi:hypothetical protein [Plantibacter sp. CFBP 8775]|uniref:hypothetical protein n=1 Tax=Plantibacter sp. CFBP 8775 TaxID=2774038 RepID=UPI00177C872C|nr:hypothetical protein [Plantibacter sp. CFBP 8775]MBD8104737.1 hypothetical protein [Plantibacter sp. CFBP 8775]